MRPNFLPLTVSAAIFALLVLGGCGGGGILPGKDVQLKPEDVTPYWINFSVMDFAVKGNLVYIAAGGNGLLIFDYRDRLNPQFVGGLETEDSYFNEITVEGNYAYAIDNYDALYIIDISFPVSPKMVGTVGIEFSAYYICVSGGYVYLTDSGPEYHIIDVDPLESAHVVGNIETEHNLGKIIIMGSIACIAGYTEGLHIADISDPESPRLIRTVATPYQVYNFAIQGDYAFVADARDGLTIIDISSPSTAHIVKTVQIEVGITHVDVQDGYLYGARCRAFYVLDVDPIEDTHVVKGMEINACPDNIQTSGDRVFAILPKGWESTADCGYYALASADIRNPGAPSGFRELPSMMKVMDAEVYGRHLFTLSGDGMQIVDISQPEAPQIVKSFEVLDPTCIAAEGGYAFVSSRENGLFILDVDPVETAHICGTLSTVYCEDMVIADGLLYALGGLFKIVDITPPTSPEIIGEVELDYVIQGLAVSQGYAYVSGYTTGVNIYDVDPPDEVHPVKVVDLPDHLFGICVNEGYAYVANGHLGVAIVDVAPIETSDWIASIAIMGWVQDIEVRDDFAYTACYEGGLQIFDVSDPASPAIANVCDTPNKAYAVEVSGNYAFIADYLGGLRIIRLW